MNYTIKVFFFFKKWLIGQKQLIAPENIWKRIKMAFSNTKGNNYYPKKQNKTNK